MKTQYPHTDAEVKENQWEPITQERADDLLCCLPPARWSGCAFAVGEPLTHMHDGRAVHDCVVEVDGRFYHKPVPLVDFDPERFFEEVCEQTVTLV